MENLQHLLAKGSEILSNIVTESLTLDISLDVLGLDLELPVGGLVAEGVAAVVVDLVVVLHHGHGLSGRSVILAQSRGGEQENLNIRMFFSSDLLESHVRVRLF